jgi:hypothetical protein
MLHQHKTAVPGIPVGQAEVVRAAQPVAAPADLGVPAILVEGVDLEATATPVNGAEALVILVSPGVLPIRVVGAAVLAIHVGVTGGDTLAMAGDGAIQDTASMSDGAMDIMAIPTVALTPFMDGIPALITAMGTRLTHPRPPHAT